MPDKFKSAMDKARANLVRMYRKHGGDSKQADKARKAYDKAHANYITQGNK